MENTTIAASPISGVHFNLGLAVGEKIHVRSFSSPSIAHEAEVVIQEKSIPTDDLGQLPLQILFTPTHTDAVGLQGHFQNLGKNYPVRTLQDLKLAEADFANLNFEQAYQLWQKINAQWCLQSNLSLLENMAQVVERLKALWPNDRTLFFEEFWYIVRANLGAQKLVAYYNNLRVTEEKEKNSHEKNQNHEEEPKPQRRETLVRVRVSGESIPNTTNGNEVDELIWKRYEGEFGPHFHIADYKADKGDWAATLNLAGSSVLLIAKIHGLNQLQKATLKNFMDWLNVSLKSLPSK